MFGLTLGPHSLLSPFSSVTLSLANLSPRSLTALAVASFPFLGASGLGDGFSSISLGSSSIISGLTFSLAVTAKKIALTKL